MVKTWVFEVVKVKIFQFYVKKIVKTLVLSQNFAILRSKFWYLYFRSKFSKF